MITRGMMADMRVVAAPDKLRGTATAPAAAWAMAAAAAAASGGVGAWECDQVPMADGGEGTLDAFGGPNRTTIVSGPLGEPVAAAWRLDGELAVVEMACAAGLELAGGAEGNDPLAASTAGVGELILAAIDGGARRIVVGVGGSASTDGGLGAVLRLEPFDRLEGVELVVACDVSTGFVDAATLFGPQKGATPAHVVELRARLVELAERYRADHGVDVLSLVGAGAAGGLAGGLAVAGAGLRSGFDLVADEVGLDDRLAGADLVITAEGHLDAQSFEGKVVGGVAERAAAAGVPVVAIAGDIDPAVAGRIDAVSLVQLFGAHRARTDTVACIQEAAARILAAHGPGVASG